MRRTLSKKSLFIFFASAALIAPRAWAQAGMFDDFESSSSTAPSLIVERDVVQQPEVVTANTQAEVKPDQASKDVAPTKMEEPKAQAPVVEDREERIVPTYRQRPGEAPKPTAYPPFIYESIPDIDSSASDFVAVPDRWRQFYKGKWYDPYNQNVLKGDIPVFGSQREPWFVDVSIISDSMAEARRLPIGVGGPSTANSGSNDTFGDGDQLLMVENLVTSFGLIHGNTSFKPQDFEFRITSQFNLNYADVEETGALRVNPSEGTERTDNAMGLLEAFVDYHIVNISDRYDFISSRVGIQPFISDFRGFIYNTSEPGVRLFGNADNNKYQYNLAWFHRLDKDTNSGVNSTFEDRHEDVAIANIYRQDAPVMGHTVQANVIYRADNAGSHPDDYDNNGFLVRPASIGDERAGNIHTTYLGLTGDGHVDRFNLTEAFYYVTGTQSHSQIAQREVDISAAMAAVEASYDVDWTRFRASFFWASGDGDPTDGQAHGFDAVFDNPNFGGGDISFWQRQGIPFIGGGGVNLTNRNSLLPNLRAGKEEGQSNFVNPGLRQYNVGVDFEITPKLKLINNAAFLQFDNVSSLKYLRQDGSFSRDLGYDLSSGLLYRPFLNNNVQIRLGGAVFFTDDSFENLFGDKTLYQAFTNLILQY